MFDGAVRGKFLAGLDVEVAFVGMQRALARDVADNYVADLFTRRMLDMEQAGFAAASTRPTTTRFEPGPDLPRFV